MLSVEQSLSCYVAVKVTAFDYAAVRNSLRGILRDRYQCAGQPGMWMSHADRDKGQNLLLMSFKFNIHNHNKSGSKRKRRRAGCRPAAAGIDVVHFAKMLFREEAHSATSRAQSNIRTRNQGCTCRISQGVRPRY